MFGDNWDKRELKKWEDRLNLRDEPGGEHTPSALNSSEKHSIPQRKAAPDGGAFSFSPKGGSAHAGRCADMNPDAKVAYAFLLGRFRLSRRNGWVNERGEAFAIFPRKALAAEPPAGLDGIANKLCGTRV